MLGHIILNVSDFDVSKKVYDIIAQHLKYESWFLENDDSFAIIRYGMGNSDLRIRCDKNVKHNTFVRDVGVDHICFKAETKELVDTLHEELTKNNLHITRSPRPYPEYTEDYYAFYFRDPDGIPLEIAYY